MTSKQQHSAKQSTGEQRSTPSTSKAADTGSAAKQPPKESSRGRQEKKG